MQLMLKITLVIIDQESIIHLTQFKVIIWAKHNTHWQWKKLLKIMALVWMQI